MRSFRNFISSDFIPVEFASNFLKSIIQFPETALYAIEDKAYPAAASGFQFNKHKSLRADEQLVPLTQHNIYTIGNPLVGLTSLEAYMKDRLANAPDDYVVTVRNSGYGLDDGKLLLFDLAADYSKRGVIGSSQAIEDVVNMCCTHDLPKFYQTLGGIMNEQECINNALASLPSIDVVNRDSLLRDVYRNFERLNVLHLFGFNNIENKKEAKERRSKMSYFDSDEVTYYDCCVHSLPIAIEDVASELFAIQSLVEVNKPGLPDIQIDFTPVGFVLRNLRDDSVMSTSIDAYTEEFVSSEFAKQFIAYIDKLNPVYPVVIREHGTWCKKKNGVIVDSGVIDKVLFHEACSGLIIQDVYTGEVTRIR